MLQARRSFIFLVEVMVPYLPLTWYPTNWSKLTSRQPPNCRRVLLAVRRLLCDTVGGSRGEHLEHCNPEGQPRRMAGTRSVPFEDGFATRSLGTRDGQRSSRERYEL
jgi:hypothetical protein